MKSKRNKILVIIALAAGVVAWSPGVNEDFNLGSGNTLTSPVGVSGVMGSSNYISARSSLVAGENNTVTGGATTDYALQTLVTGAWNVVNTGTIRSTISGHNNTVRAGHSLVAGSLNTVNGAADSVVWNSAVLGTGNLLMNTGWVMGDSNEISAASGTALGTLNNVSATFGTALGRGLLVDNSNAVAVGQYNAPMSVGDIFTVGVGDATTRATGLRVTSDGSVILGRAQGDISMGAYGGN